jgi:signal transduction histidine kinase
VTAPPIATQVVTGPANHVVVIAGPNGRSSPAEIPGMTAFQHCDTSGTVVELEHDDAAAIVVDARADEVCPADVCRRVRRNPRLDGKPILVLVAPERRHTHLDALRAGADAVVDWTDGPAVVAATLDALLRRHRHHCAALDDVRRQAAADVARLRHDLDAISYAMSHDLRAPLRSIDGFSAALVDVMAGELEPTAADYLQRVRAAAGRLGNMIEALLDLSRTSRMRFTPQMVDLSTLMRAAAATVRRRYPQAPALILTVTDGLDAYVDRDLAQRLFETLFDNCCKFVANSPPVVTVEVVDAPGGRQYAIRDAGVGFDDTYAHKLFRPFQRLHAATEYPGVGMGLAIIHCIVQRHGGEVSIESRLGAGTAVRFTLAPPACGARVEDGTS